MKEQKLGRWLKKGYPHFKEECRLPEHVLPEHSFNRLTDGLGDESIIELSQPLRLAEDIQNSIDKEPDSETVPSEVWQAAITLWPACSGVRPVMESCLDAVGRIMSQFQSGKLKMSVEVVCRGMVVLGFAPFLYTGREIMEDIAVILGGTADDPPEMIKRYADTVTSGNVETMSYIDDCIAKHSQWAAWAALLLQQVRDFPYRLKPVGITPPLSAEVIGALARMLKEEQNSEP
ncbi:MAG: hypothetical protein PHQ43_05325 [Dehalococcoidales bacterium]|nr:hypothetical protein [Dehalococcoidales bacterium]